MADTLEHQAPTDEDTGDAPTPIANPDHTESTTTPAADKATEDAGQDGTDEDRSDDADTDEDTGTDDEEASVPDLESMTADRDRWKSFSRQWESRAKDSQAKVQEAEETIKKQAEELQALHAANLRREVAAEFQVPENLLHGDDRDQMVQVAKDLSAWSQTSVRPRTSAVPTPSSGRGHATTATGGRQAAADALRRLRSRN